MASMKAFVALFVVMSVAQGINGQCYQEYKAKLKAGEKSAAVEIQPGIYLYYPEGEFYISLSEQNCSVKVIVTRDSGLKRRMDFLTQYKIGCSELNESLSQLRTAAEYRYADVKSICLDDCSRSETASIGISCENDTTQVRWPTSELFDGDVDAVPKKLATSLSTRLAKMRRIFDLFLIDHIPPYLNPIPDDNGVSVHLTLSPVCPSDRLYDEKIDECVNDCSDSPCLHGGTCTGTVDGYVCDCPAGVNGHSCENDVNECYSSPCSPHGVCVDGFNQHVCICDPGYTGTNCETKQP